MRIHHTKIFIACFFICSSLLWSVDSNTLINHNIPKFSDGATKSLSFYASKNPGENSLRPDLLTLLKKIFLPEVFIETGTYFGDTTKTAAPIFPEIYSIEASSQLYQRACRQLLSYDHIFLYKGDGAATLAKILPQISKRILFYLNTHSNQTANPEESSSIIDELHAIATAKQGQAVILIGDVRLFQNSLYSLPSDEFVSLETLVNTLLEINPRYQICFLGDTLLAYPQDDTICVTPFVRASSLHRLSIAFSEFPEKDLLEADKVISRVSGNERKELQAYYNYSCTISEMDQGLRNFAALWCGLVLLNDGKIEEATMLLTHASNSSLLDWRVTRVLHSIAIPTMKTKNYKI